MKESLYKLIYVSVFWVNSVIIIWNRIMLKRTRKQVLVNRRLVSSFGRAPVCWQGGWGLKPRPDYHYMYGALNNLEEVEVEVYWTSYWIKLKHMYTEKSSAYKWLGQSRRAEENKKYFITRKWCLICNDICKWLDFLVFSNKDKKPSAYSHTSFHLCSSCGKLPTFYLPTNLWTA